MSKPNGIRYLLWTSYCTRTVFTVALIIVVPYSLEAQIRQALSLSRKLPLRTVLLYCQTHFYT